MPKFSVNKSILIKASVDSVYLTISDPKKWPIWSPWFIMDSECKITYAEDGSSYAWDGDIIGSGNMKVMNKSENKQIDYEITFLKPWKSTSKVGFDLKKTSEGVEVTWWMNGSLPFFMFWMKNMMTAFVGMDYERGLNMLKDYVETRHVPSKVTILGFLRHAECKYVGIKTICSISEVGTKMEADFKKLEEWGRQEGVNLSGDKMSIYHKFDMVKSVVNYTASIFLSAFPNKLPQGMVAGKIPACSCYVMEHVGPYRYLGNAWAAGMAYSRAKKFKVNKKIDPFEIYGNDPSKVSENDLKTTIYFPVNY